MSKKKSNLKKKIKTNSFKNCYEKKVSAISRRAEFFMMSLMKLAEKIGFALIWLLIATIVSGAISELTSAPIINSNYILVNETNKNPLFGETFFIQSNLSNSENSSVIVGFTLTHPNGTKVIDNVLGTGYNVGNESIWNSTSYKIDEYGYWSWVVLASNAINSTQNNGSFRVLSDLSIFPESYIVVIDLGNQTLNWTLSMYHNSLENYEYNFNYNLDPNFFTLTFANNNIVMNRSNYNDTNLFKNSITLNALSSTVKGEVYLGNVTIQRTLDGKIYTVPLQIGVNPPSGNADALDTPSLSICYSGTCDFYSTLQNDETITFNWTIKNTGNYTLTNCQPTIKGFDISSFGSFNLNNFGLNVLQSKELILTISQPPINSYYGKLDVICGASILGFNSSLGADNENAPALRIVVTADSGTVSASSGGSGGGGGGGGGGSSGGITSGFAVKDIIELSAEPVEKLILGRGESEAIPLKIINKGNKFLNGCLLSASEGVSSWISTQQIESIGPGQEVNYVFVVNTPLDIEEGDYSTNLVISCKESSITLKYEISVVGGEFEMEILNSERVGTKLQVGYAVESFADKEKEISLRYELINSQQKSVAEGNLEKLILLSRARVENSFNFELPKNSIGDYKLVIYANDGTDANRYEQTIRLTSKGISGFAISENNLKTMTWFGLFVILALGIYLGIKFIRKSMSTKNTENNSDKKFVSIDLDD